MAPRAANSTPAVSTANVHSAPGWFHRLPAFKSSDPVCKVKLVVYVAVPVRWPEHAEVGILDNEISALTMTTKERHSSHRLKDENACILGDRTKRRSKMREERQRGLEV